MFKGRLISGLFRIVRHRFKHSAWMIMQSVLIGVATAFAVYFLHFLVVSIADFCSGLGRGLSDAKYVLYVLLPLPFAGVALSYFFQRIFGGRTFSKSLSGLILNLDRRRPNIPFSETYTHIFSSALCVGFGGSAGLEAPSVLTGAAVASNITRFFKVNTLPRSIFIGCGSAAAISGIFDSPIAGVLFVIEGLLPEFSVSALVPIVLASASSSVVSHLLSGHDVFFPNAIVQWSGQEIFPAFLLGCVCAVIGILTIRGTEATAGRLSRMFPRPLVRMVCGALVLCLFLALFPHLRGQGYPFIEKLLIRDQAFIWEAPYLLSWLPSGALPYIIVLAAIFIKIFVSSLTIASGGDGGIFAPSMFIGAFTGYAFAHAVNLSGLAEVSYSNFTALGMCGVFTSVMRTSLAGVFLIAETTGGYQLLVPLMIVSGVSWYFGRIFEPRSIYRRSLFKSNLLGDDNDKALLKRMKVENCIVPMTVTLKPMDTLAEAEIVARRNLRNHIDVYPVVNEAGRLIGLLPYSKLLSIMVNSRNAQDTFISEIMDFPDGMTYSDDTIDHALTKMEVWHLNFLPVSIAGTGRFIGVTTKEKIFDKYRMMNVEIQRHL